MCILTASLFLGGYLLDLSWLIDVLIYLMQFTGYSPEFQLDNLFAGSVLEGLIPGFILGIKSSILVFTFI